MRKRTWAFLLGGLVVICLGLLLGASAQISGAPLRQATATPEFNCNVVWYDSADVGYQNVGICEEVAPTYTPVCSGLTCDYTLNYTYDGWRDLVACPAAWYVGHPFVGYDYNIKVDGAIRGGFGILNKPALGISSAYGGCSSWGEGCIEPTDWTTDCTDPLWDVVSGTASIDEDVVYGYPVFDSLVFLGETGICAANYANARVQIAISACYEPPTETPWPTETSAATPTVTPTPSRTPTPTRTPYASATPTPAATFPPYLTPGPTPTPDPQQPPRIIGVYPCQGLPCQDWNLRSGCGLNDLWVDVTAGTYLDSLAGYEIGVTNASGVLTCSHEFTTSVTATRVKTTFLDEMLEPDGTPCLVWPEVGTVVLYDPDGVLIDSVSYSLTGVGS